MALILGSVQPARAHDYWLRPQQDGAKLVYGHAEESEPYQKSVMKEMKAYTGQTELPARPVFEQGVFSIKATGANAFLAIVDDGPWSKTTRGWKRGSKKDHKKVIRTVQELFYAKLVSDKDRRIGLPLEIVVENSQPSGEVVGKVFFKGKPAKGVALQINHKDVARTDASGSFIIHKRPDNPLILRAAYREKTPQSPELDEKNHVCTLTLVR